MSDASKNEKIEKRIQFVCSKTGWDYDYANNMIRESIRLTGSTYEYYAGFQLWKYSIEEQKTFFLKREADHIFEMFNKDNPNVKYAWNKGKFLKRFSDYLGRPWILNTEMDLQSFTETFQGESRIIYKPKSASAGAGIRVYDLTKTPVEDAYNEISSLDPGVVEGFLHQHEEMQKLSLKGVNTIRVVTISTPDQYTGLTPEKVYIAYAALRMCQGDSFTDNAHQGGMVAGIDLKDGVVTTNAFDYNNVVHEKHPDTGTIIKGFKIPCFKELKELIEKAGKGFYGYFGWDIAISETGPVVIEINSHPGAELLQMPYVPEGKGMRYVMKRFIEAEPIDTVSTNNIGREADKEIHDIPMRYEQINDNTWRYSKGSSKARIMIAGDMICGYNQMTQQIYPNKGWDFTESFKYTKEIMESSDFAIANLESMFAPGSPYISEIKNIDNIPNNNASPRYLEAVRFCGFDAAVISNNHNCDAGKNGLLETIDQLQKHKLIYTGLFRTSDDQRYIIADINSIKVAFLAYTSPSLGYYGRDNSWTAEDKMTHLNIYSEEILSRDIKACKKQGAEYVIVYMHWGEKNSRSVSALQKQEATAIANAGADFIVGSNPHMIQRYDQLKTSDGKIVPCYYSLGNFQSVMNQKDGNRNSVVACMELEKDAFGAVRLMLNKYIPCHTYSKIQGSRWAPVCMSESFHKNLKKIKADEHLSAIKDAIGDKILPIGINGFK